MQKGSELYKHKLPLQHVREHLVILQISFRKLEKFLIMNSIYGMHVICFVLKPTPIGTDLNKDSSLILFLQFQTSTSTLLLEPIDAHSLCTPPILTIDCPCFLRRVSRDTAYPRRFTSTQQAILCTYTYIPYHAYMYIFLGQ